MSMTVTILTLSFAYAMVLAAVVGIFVMQRRRAVLGIAAALLSAGLFVVTYFGIGELRGLPSDSPLPPFFKLLWARVIEPNKMADEPGRIFMWVEELDKDNYPVGVPRAYIVPYSNDLVHQVDAALAQIQDGEQVAGTTEQAEEAEDTAERLAEEAARRQQGGPDAGTVGDKVLRMDFEGLQFMPLPAPVTPEKPL